MTGLTAANLPAVPFNPANRPNIASDRFDSERPDTWGFVPAARRVFGLAVHEGRLYYSVMSGPQIWSVGIERDGRFAADPRWELDVPAQTGALPVSDIAFSQKGAMILAQRALIAGAYDYSAFTRPGEPQVFRVWLKGPNDPPSPGRWKPVPEEYAVGFAGNHRNTNGGVALGYGYDRDGLLHTGSCEHSLWTTGQNLRVNPALQSRLEPGGPLLVHGLAGMPSSPVRPFNQPPWTSYAIDYNDSFADPRAAGHMGSVRILTQPCPAVAAYGGPGYVSNPPYISGGGGDDPVCVGPRCRPEPPVNVAIEKTAGAVKFDEKTGLWTIEFKLDVSNAGRPFAPGNAIQLSDPVPPGLTLTGAAGPGWTCTPALPISSGGINCGYAFGSGVFASSAHLTPLVLTYTTDKPGKYENCATVGIDPGSRFSETTLSDNRACDTVTIVRNVDIAIEKTAKLVPAQQGPVPAATSISYTLVVTNVGAGFTGTNVINVTDTPTPGVTFSAVTSTPDWSCQIVAGAVNCSYIGTGPAAPGDVLGNITITATATGAGPWENCGHTGVDAAAGVDTNLDNNKSCVTVPTTPSYDVSLAKSFEKGAVDGKGAFTFKVKNQGDAIPAGTTIKINDSVPVGVTLTGLGGTSSTNWTCTPAFNVTGPATLTCTYTGTGTVAANTFLPDLVLNSDLAPASGGTEIGIYQNCGTVGLTNSGATVPETNTANNTACAVTTTINQTDCSVAGNCPDPKAVCKQDVLFIVDASVSITNVNAVKTGIKNFLVAMQNKGGSANIFSFNNGGIGTSNPSWTDISGGWQLVTSANAPTLASPITLGGTRTNWDDALRHGLAVRATAPLQPPLVLFITDGEPTAYINDTSNLEIDANTMPVTASQEAVTWINQIRAAGSPLIAVGFGAVSTSGYLDAAFTGNSSGPGNVNLTTSSVIKMSSVSSLPGVLATLGNQMCGTLSLNKRITNGPTFYHQIPINGTSVAVNDTVNFSLQVTNNAATPVTGITVQDQVPAVLTNVAVTPPGVGTSPATPPGNLITWSGITLGAQQTATLSFTGKFVKTYTAPAYESYTNYAQVTAADNYTATTLGNMNPVSGPVTEADESFAKFNEQITKETANPCLGENAPTSCFLGVHKYRTNPGSEDTSCTSSAPGGPANPCPFTISVTMNNIPPGSTVSISDQLTLANVPVTWPGSATPATFCTTPPTTVSFTCTHTPAASFSGNVTVMIPPGQTGQLKNCITVTVTNTTTTPPFNKAVTSCANVQLTQPSGMLACPQGTTKRGSECLPPVCSPPMVPGPVAGQCICPQGTTLRGEECVKVTTCQPPMVPGPVAGQCLCPKGTVLRGRECVKVPECRPPMVPGPVAGQCICPAGMVRKGSQCVPRVICREPAKLNRQGTACVCPDNMDARGNSCVPRGPRITPDDVIRVIPGFPGQRGGGGGGGGGSPNEPRGGSDKR
ncbi:MAG: hypothetical protein Q8M31_11315 [Beijerinckiaceae bacterium]|nr:hypothetical protein [Beijerinckiaceae bacterium]